MKVYIVFEDIYSDRHVRAVFSEEETAVIYAVTNGLDEVKEYEVDEIVVEGDPRDVHWKVNYYIPRDEVHANLFLIKPPADDGTVIEISPRWVVTYVTAKTKSEAIKKASDYIAKWKAEKNRI